jgi:endonuclease/exonuclease/phosphatase family metal-dependent hydrolase
MNRWIGMLLGLGLTAAGGEELRVATFNVRYDASGDRGERDWKARRELVVATVERMKPDVMGVQEALHGQKAFLEEKLTAYAVVGVGRDDGARRGEYSPIAYRRDRFVADAEEQGTFWLSATPEVPGSKSWGNEIPRICSWVRLTDLAGGAGVYVFNTHWDHQSQPSRVEAGRLLAARIAARKHGAEPVVVLGDFNATVGNPAVAWLLGKTEQKAPKSLRAAFFMLHPDDPNCRSFHGWTGVEEGREMIDHVLISEHWEVREAWVERHRLGTMWPSDHYPVGAVLVRKEGP